MRRTDPGLWTVVKDELKPYEGRLGQTVRMTVLVMVIVAVSMALRVPEAALSCYLVFFAARDNAASSIQIGLALIAAASVGILLAFIFLMISADEPGLRLLFVAIFTFAGMFFSQASRLGPISATVGFVFAFALTLYDEVPIPELLTRGLAWIWVVVFFPMFFMIVLNVVAGPDPARLVRREIAARIKTAADLLSGVTDAASRAGDLLARGNEPLFDWCRNAAFLARMDEEEQNRTRELIAASYDLVSLVEATGELPTHWHPGERQALLERLASLEAATRKGRRLPARQISPSARTVEPAKREILKAVAALEEIVSKNHVPAAPEPAAKEPFLAPDAFSNPAYTRFALKTLLAVMVCYLTYTGLQWFDIHTAMITGYYVALGTTGETIHKMTLRIAGAVIGAIMGIGSILFVMPYLTDIGQLLALVGVGTFLSAWVSNGSTRIQYVGWQMALCFFLTVLHGFGPSYDLGVASSRVIGILFGNAVIGVIFIYLWPVSVASTVGRAFSSALATLSDMLGGMKGKPSGLEHFYPQLEKAERSRELAIFELARSGAERSLHEMNSRLDERIADLAAPVLMLSRVSRDFPAADRRISEPVHRAFAQFQAAAAAFLHDCSLAACEENHETGRLVWRRAFPKLRRAVLNGRMHQFGRQGAQGRVVNAELQARLLLCRRIDERLERLASVWS